MSGGAHQNVSDFLKGLYFSSSSANPRRPKYHTDVVDYGEQSDRQKTSRRLQSISILGQQRRKYGSRLMLKSQATHPAGSASLTNWPTNAASSPGFQTLRRG